MTTTLDWSHTATLTSEPASASRARSFVAGRLADHHLMFLLDSLLLVTSELATNAITHAGTPFTIELSGGDSSVRLVVTDGDPSLPVREHPRVTDPDGRGLLIVELLSTSWGVTSHGSGTKSVWASFPAHTTDTGSAVDLTDVWLGGPKPYRDPV